MHNNYNSKFLILGDYNLPNVKWNSINYNATPNLSNVSNFDFDILSISPSMLGFINRSCIDFKDPIAKSYIVHMYVQCLIIIL